MERSHQEYPALGEAGTAVSGAGIAIVHAYLPRLFSMLDLTSERGFPDIAAMEKAVHLLYYLSHGKGAPPEYALSLEKALCGAPPGIPFKKELRLEPVAMEMADSMLTGVIGHWKALGSTSLQGLRETFLKRSGWLYHEDGVFRLKVQSSPFDVLLARLPWGISIIKYPWMPEPLHVAWGPQ
jgi:hypothetical protein